MSFFFWPVPCFQIAEINIANQPKKISRLLKA